MFIDKQEFEELPYLERNRNWLSLFSGFNTASAIIEFFTTSTYAVIFFTSANISKNWILSFVLSSVLSICSVVIIAWIVSSQRLALRKLFGSFETKPKFDDITYFIAVIAITAILVIAGNEGDKLIFHEFNSYTPETQQYSENNDYNEKKQRKESVKSEQEKAISEAKDAAKNCSECKIIEGSYASKINKASKGKITRFKPSESTWAASVNRKIESEVSSVRAEMNGKILEAKGRAESKRDSIIDSYDNRVSFADKDIVTHQSKIDSTNTAEFFKKHQRERLNVAFAGYLVVFTQLLFFVGAGGQAFMFRKAKKVWHDVEGALGASDFTAPIAMFINIQLTKVSEYIKLKISKFMAEEAVALVERRNTAFDENNAVRLIYESNATTIKQAEYLINKRNSEERGSDNSSVGGQPESHNEEVLSEQNPAEENNEKIIEENSENVSNSDGTLSDRELIEQFIESLKYLLGACDESDLPIVQELINYLTYLKNSL